MSNRRKRRGLAKKPANALEIVHGPMPNAWNARLSEEGRAALQGLHELLRRDPRTAVAELRDWISREPSPIFFNWLGAALTELGDEAAADENARENYRRNPDYLFARVNYAELCLASGDLSGVREALGETLDIRRLLGGRKRNHVSEAAGFFYVSALYRIETGDREAAERLYELLEGLAPGDSTTETVRRRLWPGLRGLFPR
jgi:tetratricopeptide (TPR) repeat protein